MANNVTFPRMRVSRTATLNITTTWQKLDFSGVETLNVNTFGIDPNTGLQMVMWDSTNKLFKFNHQDDVNYTCLLQVASTVNIITTRASLQYRIVIPNGVSAGVDFYAPFTNFGGYGDIYEATLLAGVQLNKTEPLPLYASALLRSNGFYVDLRLSNSLITLGTCTLNYAVIQILGQR